MKIPNKIEMSDVKAIFTNLSKNLGWVFLGLFFILIIFEIIEIKQSVQIVLNANKEPVIVSKQQGVRINFKSYDEVIFRIEQAQSFEPTSEAVISPFSLTPISQ